MKTPDQRPEDPEELVYADDAVVGRAYRFSAVALVVLILAGVGLVPFVCALAFPDRREELAPETWDAAPEGRAAVAPAE